MLLDRELMVAGIRYRVALQKYLTGFVRWAQGLATMSARRTLAA